MNYDHPNITVEELHPGYFVIGYTPQAIATPEGTLVPPGLFIIPPQIPADLLRSLADEKDGAAKTKFGLSVKEIREVNTTLEPPDDTDDTPPLLVRVSNLLSADGNGKLRMKELVEALGCTSDEIKALDGQGFTIGHAGWVTLNEGGDA